jgi:hypothetical protein
MEGKVPRIGTGKRPEDIFLVVCDPSMNKL